MPKKLPAEPIITDEKVISRIYLVRKQKIMIDRDLAELYGVTTGNLNLAAKRNSERFPPDFMFQLTKEEHDALILQNAISKNKGRGGVRKLPYAFTEHGVLMLSSVLNSSRAILVNIQIMRIYSKMREMILTNQDLLNKIENLEKQTLKNTKDIQSVFDYLKQMLLPVEQVNRQRIGFKSNNSNR